jgi:hypothetical protein
MLFSTADTAGSADRFLNTPLFVVSFSQNLNAAGPKHNLKLINKLKMFI